LEDGYGLISVLINLAIKEVFQDKPAQALDYLRLALAQAEATGTEIQRGRIFLNMGYAYRVDGNWAQAEAYARKAETIFRQTSDLPLLANVWNNLGTIFFLQQRRDDAMAYFRQSLELWQSLRNTISPWRSIRDTEFRGAPSHLSR